jgi:L-iditol 2-dehydrogenase
MLEPLGVAMHAVGLGKLKPGMAVGVFGVGPIGLMVIQLARLAGAAAVVVTDRLPHRLELPPGTGRQGILVGEKLTREVNQQPTERRGWLSAA